MRYAMFLYYITVLYVLLFAFKFFRVHLIYSVAPNKTSLARNFYFFVPLLLRLCKYKLIKKEFIMRR